MNGTDVFALAGVGLGAFSSAVVNPLLLLALMVAAVLFAATVRVLRAIGFSGGFLVGIVEALSGTTSLEAGTATAASVAGGLLLAELAIVVVLPTLRAAAAVAAAGIDLVRLARYRLGRSIREGSVHRRGDP